MNYGKGYIRPIRSKKVEEKLGIHADSEEKIVTIGKEGIFFKDDKTEDFYKKYEKELNSFKMEDLKKIYDETGVSIYRTIRYLQPKKNDNDKDIDIGGFVVQPTSIYYWGYDKDDVKYKYFEEAKESMQKRKKLDKLRDKELEDGNEDYYNTSEYDEFFIDVEYLTFVDKLGKDDAGIYIVNNHEKEYIYPFKKTEKIEFSCDIKLIKDLLSHFGSDISVTKLNAYTIFVKINVDILLFKKWAKTNIESITILSPSYLKEEFPQSKLTTTIKERSEY